MVSVSTGFWIVLGWFALSNGLWLTAMILLAAISHELGHLLALHCQGILVNRVSITALGAEIDADMQRLSYGMTLVCLLSGVVVNFLCAVGFSRVEAPWATVLAGVHCALCILNLLPIRPLDGGQAMELVLRWLWNPGLSEMMARRVERMVAIGMSLVLVWLMVTTGGSLWLAPGAMAFLVLAFGKK